MFVPDKHFQSCQMFVPNKPFQSCLMFVPDKIFQPCLMFVSNARAYLSKTPFMGSTVVYGYNKIIHNFVSIINNDIFK